MTGIQAVETRLKALTRAPITTQQKRVCSLERKPLLQTILHMHGLASEIGRLAPPNPIIGSKGNQRHDALCCRPMRFCALDCGYDGRVAFTPAGYSSNPNRDFGQRPSPPSF